MSSGEPSHEPNQSSAKNLELFTFLAYILLFKFANCARINRKNTLYNMYEFVFFIFIKTVIRQVELFFQSDMVLID